MITISTFLNVWGNVLPYLVAIIFFLLLIIIHEFGHFIAAKLLGVKVNEFAVGFGPKLFSKQGKETPQQDMATHYPIHLKTPK